MLFCRSSWIGGGGVRVLLQRGTRRIGFGQASRGRGLGLGGWVAVLSFWNGGRVDRVISRSGGTVLSRSIDGRV